MRFQVPQFIGVEDKILGPFTLKQFVYLAGGAGLCFIIYRFLGLFFGIFLIIPVAALSLALSFYKVNGKPFIEVLESAMRYGVGNRLYVWKKKEAASEKETGTAGTPPPTLAVPKLSESRLKDLTWSLDIKEIQSPGAKETMGK